MTFKVVFEVQINIFVKNDAIHTAGRVYSHSGATNHMSGQLTYVLICLYTRPTGWSVAPKIRNACTHGQGLR